MYFFLGYGNHRYLHVLTHSSPTRRSSDLRSVMIGAPASAPHGQFFCVSPPSWLPAFSSGIVIIPPGLAGSEQMRTVIEPPASLSIIQPGDRKSTRLNSSP